MDKVALPTILTIGHSTHSYDRFRELLRGAGVTAIADVRTSPFSRYNMHFNRDILRKELHHDAISYVFLGEELGGRPNEARYYSGGVADYEKMAMGDNFNIGLERLLEGGRKYRIALMCSEANPLDCHRCLLVGRALGQRGVRIAHVLSSGEIMNQTEIEEKLLEMSGKSAEDLFAKREERLDIAYRVCGKKIAFAELREQEAEPMAESEELWQMQM
jgi:uncharacterized protein (DUF488 family)